MPPRCLVVDDNERFLQVAKRLLEMSGQLAVDVATDISSATVAIEVNHPDAILIDVSLGEESGFDLVRVLAGRFEDITGRIIIISTRAEEDYEGLIEEYGVAGFLAKSDLSVSAIQRLVRGIT